VESVTVPRSVICPKSATGVNSSNSAIVRNGDNKFMEILLLAALVMKYFY
jgi:hypothetical protein